MTQMAHISGEKWHIDWDSVVQEANDLDTETLHADWKAYITQRYEEQAQPSRSVDWFLAEKLCAVGKRRDAEWNGFDKEAQNEAMDSHGALYQEGPSWSPDGNYLAWFDKGLNIRRIRAEEWGAIGGQYVSGDDQKSLRDYELRTATYDFIDYYRVAWSPDSKKLVATGPEDLFSSRSR